MSNAFFGRTDSYTWKGKTFEDKPFGIYALVTEAVLDPDTKEPRIISKCIKTDEIQYQKLIDVNAKGADLKSLVKRVDATGDISLLNQRKAIYGDGYKYPRTLEDALQKGVETGKVLESLTPDQVNLVSKLNKMSFKERKAFLESLNKKVETPKTEPIKEEVK